MRRIACVVVLAAVLAFSTWSIVFAQDFISDAAQTLQNTPVYVAPGTEGTNNDTTSRLQSKLRIDDNIVLIMLPASAETELGVDISVIASRLSEQLGNQRIIGLAVGKKVVGYAPSLPAGIAADQMRRADSVSNDPVTALSTFVQNMHIWQAAHPQPTPSLLETPKKGNLSWVLWFSIFVVLGLVISGLVSLMINDKSTANKEKTRFKAPDRVKDLLFKIAQKREQVNNGELRQVLYQMCLDIERYFQKSSKDKERDALFFKDRLTEVADVLTKYIEIQQAPRYYFEPETELRKGKEAICDFSKYVLDSIRRGHAVDLLDYTVNTKILEAQRYR